jgi:hypothetical protein
MDQTKSNLQKKLTKIIIIAPDTYDEATLTVNTETEDGDLEDMNVDKKPTAVSMEDIFDHDLTQGRIPDSTMCPSLHQKLPSQLQ